MRILIIDDDVDLRNLLERYIRQQWRDSQVDQYDPLDHDIPPASFPLGNYDVMILDYMLGRGDGLQWLQEFKRRADCPPILFLTGAGNEIIAVRAMKAGADDYQRKQELTREKLITSIRDLTAHASERTLSPELAARMEGQSLGARMQIPGIKVLHLIGEGGMSRVYLASREGDDEPLVVKILRSEVMSDRNALARFMEEYAMFERIHSEHVARIYTHGASDGHAYLVMEFFEGGDLNKRLGGKALPAEEAVRLLRDLMFALGDIHEQGILHRDLKPQNLMFRTDGSLAVVDFGIAKHIDAADRTGHGEILGTPRYMSPEQVQGRALDLRTDSSLAVVDFGIAKHIDAADRTGHGEILGTPRYMSPEQVQGRALDLRTDIYSAGVLLFQMLTGRHL